MTEPYPAVQIDALRALLMQLRQEFPQLRQIAGHEDLDTAMMPASDDSALQIHRKLDPGRMFPWPAVLRDSELERIGSA